MNAKRATLGSPFLFVLVVVDSSPNKKGGTRKCRPSLWFAP